MNSTGTFPYTFSLPNEFVPLSLDTRTAALQTAEALAQLGVSEEQVGHALVNQEYMLLSLASNDVCYAATFLGRSDVDPTALTTALFTVAYISVPTLMPDSLDAMLTAGGREPNTEALEVQLKVGSALAVTQESTVRTTQSISGHPEDEEHRVRQLQVMIPDAEAKMLSTFAMSTEFVRDWDSYAEMMAEIMRTVELPVEESGLQQRLRGL